MWVVYTFRMLGAIGEVLILNLYIHDNAKILSHQIATIVCFRLSTACSSAIQCMNISINSMSDIDIHPVGFVGGNNLSWIAWDH